MKRIINLIVFLLFTYSYGIFVGIVFHLLRLCKKIQLLHLERFPRWEKGVILVSNHPSLLEPFLLPALFFRQYLFHPFKYAPWSTPDRKNFYDPWYWFWLRPLSVPVDRRDEREELKSFFRMKKLLLAGKIVILFPEGGRTEKGEDFLYSQKGERIRIFEDGLGWLVLKTGALVLPVWVKGTDKVLPNVPDRLFSRPNLKEIITIKIGKPLRFKGLPAIKREGVTQMIANALLRLADEPC
jgi:1-acyl-sn-glycerol-3-phosphate acyltransferase